jgi:hypothetical protein
VKTKHQSKYEVMIKLQTTRVTVNRDHTDSYSTTQQTRCRNFIEYENRQLEVVTKLSSRKYIFYTTSTFLIIPKPQGISINNS